MFFRFSRGVAASLLLSLAATACQTSSGPDFYTDRSEIAPWDSRFNTFALLPAGKTYRIDQSTETNDRQIVETISGPERLSIYIQHASVSWYGGQTKSRIEDRAEFESFLKDVRGKFTITPLTHAMLGPNGFTAESAMCSVAKFSKRSNRTTIWDNDHGDPDTIVYYIACGKTSDSGYPSAADFVRQFDLMTPEQRERIRSLHKASAPISEDGKPIPFRVIWTDVDDSYSGMADLKEDTLTVTLPDNTECALTEPLSAAFKSRNWQLVCNDGTHATGSFAAATNAGQTVGSKTEYGLYQGAGYDQNFRAVYLKIGKIAPTLAKKYP